MTKSVTISEPLRLSRSGHARGAADSSAVSHRQRNRQARGGGKDGRWAGLASSVWRSDAEEKEIMVKEPCVYDTKTWQMYGSEMSRILLFHCPAWGIKAIRNGSLFIASDVWLGPCHYGADGEDLSCLNFLVPRSQPAFGSDTKRGIRHISFPCLALTTDPVH